MNFFIVINFKHYMKKMLNY